MRTWEIFRELILLEDKSLKEFFNLKNFYNSKQSRIEKPTPFICSQNQHKRIFESSFLPSLGKIQSFDIFLCLSNPYGTICAVEIEELLRNFYHCNLSFRGPSTWNFGIRPCGRFLIKKRAQ